ncbi:LysR family transcriptional regulator [Nocardioides sp. Iso805N]|uniref:LysR family transcriptional regulator n=1 Tax=Nocardioides sp. Iso805N TaxID=1283287 RepID=UPI00037779C6|nr:LysR family transcriptional regulator [Nocardioides sp. Iso805N]
MDRWSPKLAPHVAALVALAENECHMTRAASALGIPQSSMSRRIHALEEELGLPLLIHDGRIVRLTPAAQQFARQAREPLRDLERLVGAITGAADPDTGTVRFGFPLTMGSGLVPDLLVEFRRRFPGIRVALKQAHGAQLAADLLAGSLDLALTIPAPDRLQHTVVGTQEIHVLLPEDHRFAEEDEIRLEDLRDETFIANPASYNLRQLTESWCRKAGFRPDVALEVTEFATIRELISRGLGIALLPHDERTPPGIVERPLVGEGHHRDIALVWGAAVEAPATRRLSTFLRGELA